MPEGLISPKETLYFRICMVVSVLVYLVLIVSIVGLFYIFIGVAFFVIAQGLMLGNVRGNAVRVSPRQYPDLHATTERLAARMAMTAVPSVYVVQEGSYLNAFAAAFFGRNFMIVYSAVYELACEHGEAELEFIVAHEMAHLKRRHTLWKGITYPASLVPFLHPAYSRGCEYTADAMAAYCVPDGAGTGILLLAAGKKLYREVDGNEFIAQIDESSDVFVWLAEKLASHPRLPKRLLAIAELQSAASLVAGHVGVGGG
jgi:Zn-dependent protease with chaperone function